MSTDNLFVKIHSLKAYAYEFNIRGSLIIERENTLVSIISY